jgi:hypothetical protein
VAKQEQKKPRRSEEDLGAVEEKIDKALEDVDDEEIDERLDEALEHADSEEPDEVLHELEEGHSGEDAKPSSGSGAGGKPAAKTAKKK